MKRTRNLCRTLSITTLFLLLNIFLIFNFLAAAPCRDRTKSGTRVSHEGGYGAIRRAKARERQEARKRGERIRKLPCGCGKIYRDGAEYYRCGSIYYEPYYQGRSVVYILVDKP